MRKQIQKPTGWLLFILIALLITACNPTAAGPTPTPAQQTAVIPTPTPEPIDLTTFTAVGENPPGANDIEIELGLPQIFLKEQFYLTSK